MSRSASRSGRDAEPSRYKFVRVRPIAWTPAGAGPRRLSRAPTRSDQTCDRATSIWPVARTPNRSGMRRERVFCGRMAETTYRQQQNVARVVANATHCFGREALAPGGGVERVAEFALECQRDAGGGLGVPEPCSANPAVRCRGFDGQVRQAAAPDQHAVLLAQHREMAERTFITFESAVQPRHHLGGRTRPAGGIKTLRDFGKCVNAREERQIVRLDPPQHETGRLQPVRAMRQSLIGMALSCRCYSGVCRRVELRAATVRGAPSRGAPKNLPTRAHSSMLNSRPVRCCSSINSPALAGV